MLGVLKPAAAVVAAARAAARAGRRDGACMVSEFRYVQSVFMGAMDRKCTRSEEGGRLSRQRVTKVGVKGQRSELRRLPEYPEGEERNNLMSGNETVFIRYAAVSAYKM